MNINPQYRTLGAFTGEPEKAETAAPAHTPTPWELIEATEHHGAYIVNSWGRTICDLYAMSNPMAASVRNGGTSFPVHFDDMAANAAFIVKAVNAYASNTAELRAAYERVAQLEAVLGECQDYFEERADVVDGDYGEPGPNEEMRMLNIIDEVLP